MTVKLPLEAAHVPGIGSITDTLTELVAHDGDLDVLGVLASQAPEQHASEPACHEVEEGQGPCSFAPIGQDRLEVLLRHQMRHPARVVILIDGAGLTDYFCGEGS